MTFLSPWPLLLSGAVALGVVALHLLTTRRPPAAVLPTARFVPLAEARAVARTSRPTDLLLLALRVLAVLLIGAAFARPVFDAAGPAVRTVVMLDISRAVADPAAARALAEAEIGEGGALVVFDSAARELPLDSLATVGPGRGAIGYLSPALVVARRAAARIARGADSVRLVLVSPLVDGALDAATPVFRAAWPGRLDLRRVAAATDTARGAPATLVTALEDDPLAPAVADVGGLRGGHRVRIVRESTGAVTGVAAGASDADVVVYWPATFEDSIVPAGVTAFDPAGTGSATIVAPLARLSVDAAAASDGARVIARWNDGTAAAVQVPAGENCVRYVGVGVPLSGDLTLRAPFTRFLETLLAPCNGVVGAPLAGSDVDWLASTAPLASAAVLAASSPAQGDRWPLILLAIATVLLVAEVFARRRRIE
ncbi:MAG TPA: BatA domain-containing protein [Gemmatimonadaceae bacterium]|nr:BatA domain-containing protein [Gemmatimonadaceae bacterium]